MRTYLFAAVLLVSGPAFGYEATVPEGFQFGEGLEAHQALLDEACDTVNVRELDPAQNQAAQESLVQADCDGFDYFGADRFAEFVFADGKLTHVWILTAPEDEATLRETFEAAFGAPSHEAEAFIAFTHANAAIRRDVPEALYYGQDVAPLFAAWFDQASGQ